MCKTLNISRDGHNWLVIPIAIHTCVHKGAHLVITTHLGIFVLTVFLALNFRGHFW